MVYQTNFSDNTTDYLGTAAERAALSTTGLVAFSTFWETDTKKGYVWDGSAWKEV